MERPAVLSTLLISVPFVMAVWAGIALNAAAATDNEYAKHFGALSKLRQSCGGDACERARFPAAS